MMDCRGGQYGKSGTPDQPDGQKHVNDNKVEARAIP
jgi:hypothetical protein